MKISRKDVPNILTLSRLVLSLVMLTIFDLPKLWLVLCLLAGITDVLDGYFARRFNASSALGTRLDSLADYTFYGTMLFYIFINHGDVIARFAVGITLVIALHVLNLAVGLMKYKVFVMIHSYIKKLTGLMSFFIPFFVILFDADLYVLITIIVAVLGCVEELLIIMTSKKLNMDRKSLFFGK